MIWIDFECSSKWSKASVESKIRLEDDAGLARELRHGLSSARENFAVGNTLFECPSNLMSIIWIQPAIGNEHGTFRTLNPETNTRGFQMLAFLLPHFPTVELVPLNFETCRRGSNCHPFVINHQSSKQIAYGTYLTGESANNQGRTKQNELRFQTRREVNFCQQNNSDC